MKGLSVAMQPVMIAPNYKAVLFGKLFLLSGDFVGLKHVFGIAAAEKDRFMTDDQVEMQLDGRFQHFISRADRHADSSAFLNRIAN